MRVRNWRSGGKDHVQLLNHDPLFHIEFQRNGDLECIHGNLLNFYSDHSVEMYAIISHVLSSETGMPIARLLRLERTTDGLKATVRWRGLPYSENTPIEKV